MSQKYDAWHPGIESEIPTRLLPLVTIFRPENSEIDYAKAKEIAEFCGLDATELVSFRPERLVIHELLIRVTADLSVPDGPSYEELGINLRSMVATIFDKYITPDIQLVRDAFGVMRTEVEDLINRQLTEQIFFAPSSKRNKPQKISFIGKLLGRSSKETTIRAQNHSIAGPPEIKALSTWNDQLVDAKTPLEKACLAALIEVVGGIIGHRGRLMGDRELITRLASNLVCNTYGSEKIGALIEPILQRAVIGENYQLLPAQKKPVVMNVKGASAAGKSTIRPQQRQLAEKLGVPWEYFALISPDYWRKFLINYDSLGPDYKYAAMLTGQELEIIDKKLDRYMAEKASRGAMSHLLIDRFRFDSFVLDNERSSDSKLLTRFGDLIFMFFMVTPPEATVERAFQRGLKTGRYKAVDDLLFHNVEAYTGMPELFFSWVLSKEKRVHYEFLDNDVPKGDLPRTAAFGWNNNMTILDVKLMIDIERYRKVNIEAKKPAQIFEAKDMAAKNNIDFLKRCSEQIAEINFADQSNGYVYARMEHGKPVWCDHRYVKKHDRDRSIYEVLEVFDFFEKKFSNKAKMVPLDLVREKNYTLGRWNQ